jgi:precorrin-6B C5,15-methyltransferase / cobalt-precorrin-6B C5,C15-methyltransferase
VLNKAFPDGVDEIKNTPDRIFIGERGKNLKQIINRCCEKLTSSGVIVIDAVLIQNFEAVLNVLKELRFEPQAVQIQISRSKAISFVDRFEILNPVWVISGTSPGTSS